MNLPEDVKRLCESMMRARELFLSNRSNADLRAELDHGSSLVSRLRWPSQEQGRAVVETD